jgi:hypothetical protein
MRANKSRKREGIKNHDTITADTNHRSCVTLSATYPSRKPIINRTVLPQRVIYALGQGTRVGEHPGAINFQERLSLLNEGALVPRFRKTLAKQTLTLSGSFTSRCVP